MFKFLNHYVSAQGVIAALVEGVALLLLALVSWHLFSETSLLSGEFAPVKEPALLGLVLACLAVLACFYAVGLYNRDAFISFNLLLLRMFLGLVIVAIVSAFAYSVRNWVPVLWVDYWGVAALAAIGSVPVIVGLRTALSLSGRYNPLKKRVLVIGRGEPLQKLKRFFDGEGRVSNISVGLVEVTDLDALREQHRPQAGESFLVRLANDYQVDEIVIATDEWRGLPVMDFLACRLSGIRVSEYLSFWERETRQIDLDEVKPSWLTLHNGFQVQQWHDTLKRMIDIAISGIMLILLAPLILLTMIAIKLDSPGPVFYLQERVGLNGRVFRLIKFRSMRTDAESSGVPQWAAKNDPRVTRVGNFIRKTRIDEIPQFFNVLLGDMSLVGPRPERPYFVESLEEQIPLYSLRHSVRPGVTGWAQINYPYGASVEDARRKIAYDLYYVKNRSVVIDILTILQTVRVILTGDGAR